MNDHTFKYSNSDVILPIGMSTVTIKNLCGKAKASLQCRRILGWRNLVRVRNIVVAAIFDFMTVEDWGE